MACVHSDHAAEAIPPTGYGVIAYDSGSTLITRKLL